MTDATDSAAPFAGIRVVEFGQFIAVPFCSQLLAEGGAEVIKVEAPTGDPTRNIAQLAPNETRIFISRNRGKRSLPLKLSDPAAAPVIDALLGWADVALMNFRPGLASTLGLDGETLAARFPRLIIGSVTAFGDRGPDAGFAGMDIVVQARTGLMAACGRVVDGRPAAGEAPVADYMCAMTLAFGISSALLRRERTGRGGIVDTSLMQAAMTLANNQLIRSERADAPRHEGVLARLAEQRRNHESWPVQAAAMPTGRTLPLLKIYFRTYQTADADIAIACGSHRLRERFMAALEMTDTALDRITDGDHTEHYEDLQARVEARFRTQPASVWVQRLNEQGVPVSPVRFPVELYDDEHVAANGMLHTLEHPEIGPMQVVAPPLRIDGDGFRPARATPRFASETQAILTEIGMDNPDIDTLIAAGVTHRDTPA